MLHVPELDMKTNREEFVSLLAENLLLSESEKTLITELFTFKTYPKGTILFQEGDKTTESYLVIKGCIRSYLFVDGQDITTEFYTELDSYAPPSTINQCTSNCFAACLEETVSVVSTPEQENELFLHHPSLESLCRKFTEKLMARQQLSFQQFRMLTPEQRYLNLLKTRPGLIQRVPQYHLASYLGIRPESLSRIRKRLASK